MPCHVLYCEPVKNSAKIAMSAKSPSSVVGDLDGSRGVALLPIGIRQES